MLFQPYVYGEHMTWPVWLSCGPPSRTVELARAWADHHVRWLQLREAVTNDWPRPKRQLRFAITAPAPRGEWKKLPEDAITWTVDVAKF